MNFQDSWLFHGYFEVSDPSGGPSFTQQVRDGLAAYLGQPASAVRIASYPVGPAWRHTFWWREGESDYAEAQFFVRIAEEYPILSVGVSVEKGLEDARAVPSTKSDSYLLDRNAWDWQSLMNRIEEVLTDDIPACATAISRPLELRFYCYQYTDGERSRSERFAFVFRDGVWSERHVGKATEWGIIDRLRDLDRRGDWWVDAYFACDLFPHEVNGMSAEALASTLWKFSGISCTAKIEERVTTRDRKANMRLETDLRTRSLRSLASSVQPLR